jgi:predicted DCC family thiol-disulfide oxidoreductase YuxK
MMSTFALTTFGQTVTTGTDRAQLLQDQTQPSLAPGVAPDGFVDGHAVETPNDPDIGQQEVLKREAQYQPFTASFGVPVFYTSNVALTRSGERGDVVIAPVAAAFYDPRIAKNLYGHFGAQEQVFYYGKYTGFDFGSLDAIAGLNYFLPQFHNLILRSWYDFNRLTFSDRLGDEFFSNHGVVFNAELPFQLTREQQLVVGADANISVGADHQSPRRNDYEGYVGYSASLTRAFTVSAFGRLVDRDYHQNGRNDLSEIVSLTATYRLANWCSISAISAFAHSDSNQDVFDYDVANAGGALALSVKF